MVGAVVEWPPAESALPASAEPPDAPGDPPAAADGAPGIGIATSRFAVAIAIVGVLLTLTLLVLRAILRPAAGAPAAPAGLLPGLAARFGWRALVRGPVTAPADRLEIVERGYVGPKESVCIVRAGTERFLIGVTPTRISLLGRLAPAAEAEAGPPAAAPAPIDAPAAADFGRALAADPPPRPAPPDGAFRAVLARSRERLARLGAESALAGRRDD
jgi:hypothetical protein